jgi:hypothetical protein
MSSATWTICCARYRSAILKVLLGYLTPLLFHLLSLLVEDIFCLPPKLLDHGGVANIVGGIAGRDRHQV